MPALLQDIKKGKTQTSVDFVNRAFKESKTHMQNLYRNWALTLAWWRGDQNVDFSTTTSRFYKNTKSPWQARVIANKMLPLVRQQVSRMSQSSPAWVVDPATSDEEDIQVAHTSTKVMQSEWKKLEMDLLLLRALYWQETTGSAFMKVIWDADSGDEISVQTKNIEVELLDQLAEQMGFEAPPELITLNQGMINVSVVPSFNLIVDPTAAVWKETSYCIESNLRTMDWVTEHHGNKWSEKLSETNEAELFLYPYSYSASGERLPKKGVLVQDFMVKHTKKFPNGQHLVMADDQVLHKSDLPFDHGKLPYAHFISIYDPSSFWGTCVAEQVRSSQARYNRLLSGIVDHINLTSKVQWLIPREARCSQITNKPGQNIEFNGRFPPVQTQPRPIPAYVERTLERTDNDMQDISSLHRVSQGQNEPGVRSAKAIQSLQGSDDEVFGPNLAFYNQALKNVGELVIKTIYQFADEERIAETVGEFNEQEVTTFTNADLVGRSQGDYFKVRLKMASVQTMSRTARESQVGNLLELGVLHPERDRDAILGLIGMSDSLSVFDQYAAERMRQWKEVERIIAGEQVAPVFGENHRVHIDSIKKFISSGRRNTIDPKQLQAVQQHMVAHMQMMAKEMQLEANLMGVNDGTSPDTRTNGTPSSGRTSPGGRSGSQAGSRRPQNNRVRSS